MYEFFWAMLTIYLAAVATFIILSIPYIIQEFKFLSRGSLYDLKPDIVGYTSFIMANCIIYIISPIAMAIIIKDKIINEEF